MDQIYAQTITKSFVTDEVGAFIICNPGNNGIALLDIIVSVESEDFGGRVILQVGDNEHRHELFRLDINETMLPFKHNFQGYPKFWRGGRLEMIKNFKGTVTIFCSYCKLQSSDYSVWSRK
jgi:hypothetical protein